MTIFGRKIEIFAEMAAFDFGSIAQQKIFQGVTLQIFVTDCR